MTSRGGGVLRGLKSAGDSPPWCPSVASSKAVSIRCPCTQSSGLGSLTPHRPACVSCTFSIKSVKQSTCRVSDDSGQASMICRLTHCFDFSCFLLVHPKQRGRPAGGRSQYNGAYILRTFRRIPLALSAQRPTSVLSSLPSAARLPPATILGVGFLPPCFSSGGLNRVWTGMSSAAGSKGAAASHF